MLVDDEVDITETHAMYLSIHDFDVITANNALDAIEKFTDKLPDLIVSDCMMPFMDGVEFSRLVRAREDTKHIPIILMSGAPGFHDLSRGTYDVFLLKPVMMTQLIQEINSLL